MSFHSHMRAATAALEAALQEAEQARDQAVFCLGRGLRSPLQFAQLAERVAQVRTLWRHAHELTPSEPLPEGAEGFQIDQIWCRGEVLYRVAASRRWRCCCRLEPLDENGHGPIHRSWTNTTGFLRVK